MIVRNVTIDVSNPGGLSTSQSASATVNGVGSSSGGTFAYADEATVTADVAGTVSSISVAEGDQVSRGQTILQLTSDTLSEQVQSAEESLRNAQISYENQTEQLDDYTVTALITGTIVDKNYNAGEITEAMSWTSPTSRWGRPWPSPPTRWRTPPMRAWSPRSVWRAPPPAAPPPTR